MLKICAISEELSEPFDEGIKNFAYNLIRQLSKKSNMLALSIRGNKTGVRYIKELNVNKTFLSYCLFKEIKLFAPEIIIYIPSSSATFFSFMRAKVLKLYRDEARVIMISLQPRQYSFLSRKLMSFLSPDLILVQSKDVLKELHKLGYLVELIPSGVDLEKFHPVSKERKLNLRKKYNIEPGKFVILHVGHINENRNIQILKEVQDGTNQVVIVGSTSTVQDDNLIKDLQMVGAKVITDYLENIEEIYRLSDCYVFPVISDDASIEVSLSVLEAMACNLPVIATRYGGLPSLLSNGKGFLFIDNLNTLSERIEEVKKLGSCETRKIVKFYSWENVAERILISMVQLS